MQQILTYTIGSRLYLNITDRCTLVCQFCPKTHEQFTVHQYDLKLQHRPKVEEIIQSLDQCEQYEEIVFCGYGEPTLRLKELLTIAQHIKKQNGKIRLNTDGLANLVHKRNVLPEMQGLIDSLSVSMNAQNEKTYQIHCQPQLAGSFDAMLSFLKLAPQYIPHVTATAIEGLPGVDIIACEKLALAQGVKFRSRFLDIVG